MTSDLFPVGEGFVIYDTANSTRILVKVFNDANRREELWRTNTGKYFKRESRTKANGGWANWKIIPIGKKEARDWLYQNETRGSLINKLRTASIWDDWNEA